MTPSGPVLHYDRTCRLCVRVASAVRRLDGRGRLHLVASVPGEATEKGPEPGGEGTGEIVGRLLAHTMVVVTPDGRILERGEAVRAVVVALPSISWLGVLWRVPGGPRAIDAIYRVVARNRHRLGCSGEACALRQERSH
ncbi:MAG TPA: DUF393 domain-containing protein [Longimicrobiales bacterium]